MGETKESISSMSHSRFYALKNKEYRKEYYHKNKEKMLATAKKWREDNKERYKALQTQWRLNNPHKVKDIEQRYQNKQK